jgi:hypothetical protein
MKPIRMIAAALILVLSSITTFAMAASYSTDQSDLWWTDPPGYGRSSPILFAVGMRIAAHPPHRSEQAPFTHSAPTSGV